MQTAILDKEYAVTELDLGKMGLRVVVFTKRKDPALVDKDETPLDAEPDEELSSESEVKSYLESPRAGKLCCVFLINGQRHHGLDNGFIVTELKMKYLRKRMIIVVDLDELSQRAKAEIMQGSRSGLYEGQAYHKIRQRLASTLQNDPELLAIEEEAEEELLQLEAGDAAVQQALDQLIQQHFSAGDHPTEGEGGPAGKRGYFFGPDGKITDLEVVQLGESGINASEPILVSNHAAPMLRFAPGAEAKLTVAVAPKSDWQHLSDIAAFLDVDIPGLTCNLTKNENTAEVELRFVEPPGFESDGYPLEATLRVLGRFKDVPEPRLIEKAIVVRPRVPRPPPPPRMLNDVPTYLRVASRQPVRLTAGGADTHVKLVWDGADYLTFEPNPPWRFAGSCSTHPTLSPLTFTKPTNGRFEVLVHIPTDILLGTKLEFEIRAEGPTGSQLGASFSAEVVPPPGPKKVTTQVSLKGERRPPYKIVYVHEKDFASPTRWGDETWDTAHAAAFTEPKDASPLTLCINQDFGLLRRYIDGLVAKKADEGRTEEKKTKYISHVAYHLYQMYLAKEELKKKKDATSDEVDVRLPEDEEMQDEINRVASTLIKLMEVTR